MPCAAFRDADSHNAIPLAPRPVVYNIVGKGPLFLGLPVYVGLCYTACCVIIIRKSIL